MKQLNVNLHGETAENLHTVTAEDCEDTRGFEASREQFVKLGGGGEAIKRELAHCHC